MMSGTQGDVLVPQDIPATQIILELKSIGAGGFSDVYLGRWSDSNRTQQVHHPQRPRRLIDFLPICMVS
ncbi:hypothetical protein P691DRAFT_812662 [Macrolepiota fuliginosa MF-IS2]|uniref:Protein kinase domain-containing protein n=1 Tax=Macrolepiota fuliginosa MF-IS2 TaxID=1400762 RepID=A0A9P5XFE8_9AGAR|nr:hypothetical protein P691DRAFT_812662 [Macrolepiota fuliginosa MF-IS2]